ncbi:MAG: enoyl-CoA hydratase/isomerase family protein [Deltaproteobacteria bacterium]|nr:enoyl-CoA hydratase/isomerase family protein [Deltaproteobacteria bacterium]
MNFVLSSIEDDIATVTLQRGKVNALNEPMVEEIDDLFRTLETDTAVKSIIFTGAGKFFSFGFDVPEFLHYPKEDFVYYLEKFTNLCTYLFQFPKPVVAALNGHTIAGGCMLAIACDVRIMASGKGKISLNEITFGAPVFAGSVEMLRFCVGSRNAQAILYSGAMYSAEDALQLGLVDRVSSENALTDDARKVAEEFAGKDSAAFRSIKKLLRKPVAEEMVRHEKDCILEFVDIWYSETTREKLERIKIH